MTSGSGPRYEVAVVGLGGDQRVVQQRRLPAQPLEVHALV